jgi:nucleotide-binding universal stress UspA family protein
MYDRILVPTDGSEGMGGVISHAAALAEVHDAAIHGLYVVDTGRFATLPVESSWEGLTEMLRQEGEAALDDLEAAVPDDVEVVKSVEEGPPSEQIVKYAREAPCDVVVMGTHGRGGIDRLLLGSVAERVVRDSPVPVVTVPVSDVEGPVDEAEGRITGTSS